MVFEKVKDIIANQLGVSADDIKSETRLQEDLHADSLDTVELVMAAEEEFGVEIEDEVVLTFKTVGDVVGYIEKNAK